MIRIAQTTKVTLVALVSLGSVAFAQTDTGTPVPAPKPEPEHRVTIMWAPIRAIIPLVELTAEYRIAPKIGASVTVGAGKRSMETSPGMEMTGTEIEGGLQGRYYLLGDFSHGMELGAEFLYERVRFPEPLPAGVAGVAMGGGTLGAFVGYKVVTKIGFTFEAQAGARYLAMEPATQGMAGTAPIDSKWLPLLHLNVGWSF